MGGFCLCLSFHSAAQTKLLFQSQFWTPASISVASPTKTGLSKHAATSPLHTFANANLAYLSLAAPSNSGEKVEIFPFQSTLRIPNGKFCWLPRAG